MPIAGKAGDGDPDSVIDGDVVVVGAGPAGIAAAVRASESGRTVTVLDDNPAAGGQIWRGGHRTPWLRRIGRAKLDLRVGTQVVSAQAGRSTLLVEQGGGAEEIRFRTLILATGARELFVPFPGWTLPGVMGVGGLQAMAKTGMPVQGKRIVVGGSGPLLLAVAAHLKAMGARVLLIAEQASRRSLQGFAMGLWRHPEKFWQAGKLRAGLVGVPYRYGCAVIAATGQGRVQQVTLIQDGKTWTVECDFAAIAYGLWPNTELAAALGCQVEERGVRVDEWQQTSVEGIFCAGEATGIGGVELSLVEGQIAGYAAAGEGEKARRLFRERARARRFAGALNKAFELRAEVKRLTRPETIVCRCEDVPLSRLQSMASFRAAKLHTRCGMGPCQGRVCGPAVNLLFGWTTDTVRPPVFPAQLGSLMAGGERDA